ncbi:MAG: MBL fold metallo-hydrolase [Phycisphaerales bacterium]|nr:MBL fold metallo-hydrolase [Phycisphaerales bacterium]
MHRLLRLLVLPLWLAGCASSVPPTLRPSLLVLGIAQDGGIPQTGSFEDARWDHPAGTRRVACLGIVDPRSGRRWMIDATPDFRRQLLELRRTGVGDDRPVVDGIFLTHAHVGHYTGLMFLGYESLGAKGVPVFAMPRMTSFLETNGPWDQLVRYGNIELRPLADGQPVALADDLSITPLLVPHRQEYSEVVGFLIRGPSRTALYIPDIDSWEQWDQLGTRIEDLLATVDIAYLDGTFFANGEIPGRDMTGFPHPFITHTMERFSTLAPAERAKVRFFHLNHTNPALSPGSPARHAIERAGMRVAEEGDFEGL